MGYVLKAVLSSAQHPEYPKGCNNRHPLAYCRGQTGERVCGIRPGSGLSHRRRCTQRQRKSTKSAEAVSRPG